MNSDLQKPILVTERLVIRLLRPEESAKMLQFRLDNREHLQPWEPTRRPEFFTENYWFLQLRSLQREQSHGLSLCFTILNADETEVVGVCNFTNIVRGTFQSCHLGYALADRWQDQGLMFEALNAACPYVFKQLRLHRIMANYLPRNERSGKLLQNLGFEKEGLAKSYLKIDGRWEDHVLTSLINPDD